MNRYEVLERIGEGAFGTVSRARHKESGREYAIKCMKATNSDWTNVKQQREIQAIALLCQDCPHLVYVYEITREQDSKLYFVCELMKDGDLKDFLAEYRRKEERVEPALIRSILQQVLHGLQHIHSKGYMHRDLKPENLLLSGGNCKVADFSLARPATTTAGDSGRLMTTYVSSRWYRAPEIVLEATMYTTAIDIFALGCVMAELFSLEPLFPGKDEHDQLPIMLSLLGPMTQREWPEGIRLIEERLMKIPSRAQPKDITMPIPRRLAEKVHVSESSTISLLENMLKLNPKDRPSVEMALNSEYFFLHRRPPADHAPVLSPPYHATTPKQQSPVLFTNNTAAFDALPSPHETPFQQTTSTTPGMTTLSASRNNRRRATFVSISPTARNAPSFLDDDGFSAYAKVVEVGGGYSSQNAGGIARTCMDGTMDLVSVTGPSMTRDASLFSPGQNSIHCEYRPSNAFGID